MSALDVQVGGGHYKDMVIQPVEYLHKNGIGYVEGSIIKYVSRWRKKNGIEDLKKARHFLDLLIEIEGKAERIAAIKTELLNTAAPLDVQSPVPTIDDPLGTASTCCAHPRQSLSPMEHPFGHVYQCVDCGARTVK